MKTPAPHQFCLADLTLPGAEDMLLKSQIVNVAVNSI
jgi:hypothetical protein